MAHLTRVGIVIFLLHFVSVLINQNSLGITTVLHLSWYHWNLEIAQGFFLMEHSNICFRKHRDCSFGEQLCIGAHHSPSKHLDLAA